MITNEELEIASQSYTNKDFASMYPEMLDIAKRITNSWDPSTSNESDPGVVLLKEAAFVGDHLNYNIDKNTLENFLPSATQDKSVRSICEMNGYTPRYYEAATGSVSLRYAFNTSEDSNEEVEQFTIPRFTLNISDVDGTVNYTQLEDLTMLIDDTSTSSKKTMWCSCKFIEGSLNTLTINDSSTITLDNLDDNYRVYLTETNVAQNGVFIKYASNDELNGEYGYWERDNYILSRPLGTRAFKLDYDSDNGLPYIQFPSDIASIISSGLTISYISTTGSSGNVSSNSLTELSSPSTVVDTSKKEHSSENFEVKNLSAFVNGKDPETIVEMYNSFKKVVGTFETLVSCKDYSDYINTLELDGLPLVSNVYVTDRRTDYNKAANVVTMDDYGLYQENISTNVKKLSYKTSEPNPPSYGDMWLKSGSLMVCTKNGVKNANDISIAEFNDLSNGITPYDLSIYALASYSVADYSIANKSKALNNSFKPISENTRRIVKSEVENIKCLSHTYKDPSTNDVYCFKNLAPLQVSIKPYNKITKYASEEIINNVCKAISDNYNAHEVEFGEDIDTSELKSVIIKSDSRIRDVDLQPINYKTYATKYEESNGWVDKALSETTTLLLDLVAKNVLAGRVCLFDIDDTFDYEFGHTNGEVYNNVTSLGTKLELNVKPITNTSSVEDSTNTSTTYKITCSANEVTYSLYIPWSESESIDATNSLANIKYENDKKSFFAYTYSSDVVKCIAESDGKSYYTVKYTPNDGSYNLVNQYKGEHSSEIKVDDPSTWHYEKLPAGTLEITTYKVSASTNEAYENVNYTLGANESVQIISPNYYSDKTYSVYVNYRFVSTGTKISANEEHKLLSSETLVLNYTSDGVETTVSYTNGTIIKASFDIEPTDSLSTSGVKKTWVDNSGFTHNDEKFKTLASNQTISTRVQMKTVLDNSSMLCYWIVDSDGENNRLFETNSTTKILGSNEYFIYANSNDNSTVDEMMILGAGTKLVRKSTGNDDIWKLNNPAEIEAISTFGTSAVIDWKKINFNENPIDIEEMSVVSLSEGDTLSIYGWSKTKEVKDTESSVVTSSTKIDNTWRMVDGTIKYGDTVLPATNDFYYIRSRLDVNISKDVEQTLQSTTNKSTQTFKIGETSVTSGTFKASQPLYLLGNEKIDPTLYNGCSLYKYSKDTSSKVYMLGATSISGIVSPYVDSSATPKVIKPEYQKKGLISATESGTTVTENFKYEFPLCFNLKAGESLMIPVYVRGNGTKITATLKNGTTTLNIKDFNSSSAAASLTMEDGIYFITYENTGTAEYKASNACLTLNWSVAGTISSGVYKFEDKEELLIINNNFKVVNGLNKKLMKNIDNLKGDLLSNISSIISGSDKPSLKFYYLNEPTEDMAIDLDKYCIESTVAKTSSDHDTYATYAFDNPLIMFDINNVANDKTIVQVDLGGSDIKVLSSMIRG